MEAAPKPLAARLPGPGSAPAAAPALAGVTSDSLLAGRSQVWIQHRGERYLLRETRNGKLILTK